MVWVSYGLGIIIRDRRKMGGKKKKMGGRWAPKNSAHLFFLKKMGASKKKKMG